MYRHQSAGIVPYYKKNEQFYYLLLQYAAGHWDFPKGHLEYGETDEQAAVRELQEETGLVLSIQPGFKDSFSYSFIDRNENKAEKEVTFFIAKASLEQKVVLSGEHQAYEWLQLDSAVDRLTYKNAQELLRRIDIFLYHGQ